MTRFEHPLQLYQLEHPDDWEARYDQETGGVLLVRGEPGAGFALNITAISLPAGESDEPAATPAELQVEAAAARLSLRLLPETQRREERDGATLRYGEARREDTGAANATPPGSLFRFWVLRKERLALIVTQLGPGAALPEGRCAADAVVATIRLPEVLPPTAGEFQARVLETVAREYPTVKARPGDGPWVIEIEEREGLTARVGLENLYRDCLLQSEATGVIIRRYLDYLTGSFDEARRQPSYEDARPRLMPMLKVPEWLEGLPNLAAAEFAPGLWICFTIDSPGRVAYVTRDMLRRWDVPLEQVQGVAQDNLARQQKALPVMVLRDDAGRTVAMVVNSPDGYAAASLTLPCVREALAEGLGDEYLVGLPNRDFLIAFSERDPGTCAGIIRQVKRDHQRMHHPLSGTIYRVRPDSVQPTEL
jgi:hypothetical protein